MHDIVIRGGTIIDGTGQPAFAGDIAIDGGRIATVGGKVGPGQAGDRRRRPAGHTRLGRRAYPLRWAGDLDPILAPSSWHGVTTILFGNCGVGFAPVRPHHHDALIDLMEGVEDISGPGPRRGLEVGLAKFPRFSRCAGAHAADDRRRGTGSAPPPARLCNGRSRDPS